MLRLTARNVFTKINNHKAIVSLISRGQSTMETAEAQNAEPVEDTANSPILEDPQPIKRQETERMAEFRKKLKQDMAADELNKYNLMLPYDKDDPMAPWPDNVNPHTGEVGGPRGPEPTRYGDWERKGICVDF